MITISRTITNSTLGLKAASFGKHPGRRRVHSGEPIKCFKKFDRKTTTTQEVKFVYGKQFENDQIRTRRDHTCQSGGIGERTKPRRNGSHVDDWLTRGRRRTSALRIREFSCWTRPTRLPPPPHPRSCFVVTTRSAPHGNRDNIFIYRGDRCPIVTPEVWTVGFIACFKIKIDHFGSIIGFFVV